MRPRSASFSNEFELEMREYFREAKEDRTRLREAVSNLTNEITIHERKDDERHFETKAALAGLDARMKAQEKDTEITGSHAILADLREEKKEQKKTLLRVAIAVGMGLGGAGAAELFHLLFPGH